MDPHPKFPSDVKTNDNIHAPKGYEKAYYSYIMRIFGESRQVPKQVQKWVERAGKGDWVRILL